MARISSASARASASASTRDRASASARHRALLYHCISQSFDLPPATTSVSHLTCPLPPHHQSELALAQALEIELALALDIECYRITASVNHLTCPPATTSVSHLTCPLPPHHRSELALVPALETRDRASAGHRVLPYHRISQSFDLPLPPHQSVI